MYLSINNCIIKIMPTFFCEYKILDHARSDCMTYFGGMTPEDDARDLGGKIRLLGRWSTVGGASGYCVCEAPTAKSLSDWLYNWVSMASIKVTPILNDNQARRIILGQEPSYQVDYSHTNDEAKEGESLYFIKYKFHSEKRMDGFAAFAGLTEKADKQDAGSNTCLGRWHNLGTGSGIAICSSKSEEDLYKWAFNWASMCDCEVEPVVNDRECREVISGKPDFVKKQMLLMAKMA